MRHTPIILLTILATACTSTPARPDAPAPIEAPVATTPAPTEERACERTSLRPAHDTEGRVDLGPFVPGMQTAFGEDLLVCASPTASPDDSCTPLLDGVFGDAVIPHGFYLFDAKDFTLDITVLVNTSYTASLSRTACDPPLVEVASQESCEDRVHSFAEGLSEGLGTLTRSHDELDRRMIHATDQGAAVCQGLVLTHMVPKDGVYAGKIIFQHTLLSLHMSEERVDMITLTSLMLDLEGRSEVDDVLVYTANTMRETIDALDPSTRASTTEAVEPRAKTPDTTAP